VGRARTPTQEGSNTNMEEHEQQCTMNNITNTIRQQHEKNTTNAKRVA
jgi:hypothetical protein